MEYEDEDTKIARELLGKTITNFDTRKSNVGENFITIRTMDGKKIVIGVNDLGVWLESCK